MRAKLVVFSVLVMLLLGLVAARQWRPSDPRCGSSSGSYRLRRSAVTNNNKNSGGFGNNYKYNGNSGSCEKIYGGDSDYAAFNSKGECERICRNVYHFSK